MLGVGSPGKPNRGLLIVLRNMSYPYAAIPTVGLLNNSGKLGSGISLFSANPATSKAVPPARAPAEPSQFSGPNVEICSIHLLRSGIAVLPIAPRLENNRPPAAMP